MVVVLAGKTQTEVDQLREKNKGARRTNEDAIENIRRLAKNLEIDGKQILCSSNTKFDIISNNM